MTISGAAPVCQTLLAIGLVLGAAPLAHARSSGQELSAQKSAAQDARRKHGDGAVKGNIVDASGRPAADAMVSLDHAVEVPGADGLITQAVETQRVHSSGNGAFNFSGLAEGSYTLHAERTASERTAAVRVELGRNETKTMELKFVPPQSSEEQTPEFFDEPQFTVAGVTQTTNSGGHGSDVVLRTSEELVKATGGLGAGSAPGSGDKRAANGEKMPSASPNTSDLHALEQQRASVRARIVDDDKLSDDAGREQQADLHHELAHIDEELGELLAAVREYQRAVEMAPSETRLFDWASELLAHGGLEPATAVLEEGVRRYPQSVRMRLALGVAWYARGSDERAVQYVAEASDLAPKDATPYLFMGQMQSVETAPSQEYMDRLARFVRLAPENAWANYYYGAGLLKQAQAAGTVDKSSAQIEGLLQKAIRHDPKLGMANLELGILYATRGDYTRAIAAYEEAIAGTPELEEAHYRLALAYGRVGKAAEAQKELRVHEELARKSNEEAEQKRKAVQQFVAAMRER